MLSDMRPFNDLTGRNLFLTHCSMRHISSRY